MLRENLISCLQLYFIFKDILEGKICYENNLEEEIDTSEVEINRRRRDTLEFTLTDGFNTELGELDIDVIHFC